MLIFVSDIPECSVPSLNTCDMYHGYCAEAPSGGYSCNCHPGYTKLPNNTCVGKISAPSICLAYFSADYQICTLRVLKVKTMHKW